MDLLLQFHRDHPEGHLEYNAFLIKSRASVAIALGNGLGLEGVAQ